MMANRRKPEGMAAAGLRAAGAGVAVAVLAGCLGVPGAAQMREIRSAAAGRRVEDLARKTTTDSGVYLAGPLLLSEAVTMALAYNRSLQQQRQEREIARGRIEASYAEALPSLDLTGGYVRRDEELRTTTSGGESVTTRYPDQYSAGLKLAQPLFNGRIGAALRAARLYKALAVGALS